MNQFERPSSWYEEDCRDTQDPIGYIHEDFCVSKENVDTWVTIALNALYEHGDVDLLEDALLELAHLAGKNVMPKTRLLKSNTEDESWMKLLTK